MLATPRIGTDYRLYIYTDASETGMGATLCQEQDGVERIIAYASQHFNRREKKYSTIEKEAAAVLWSIDKFDPYLKGARFRILSDHGPLKWLAGRHDATGRIGRWQVRLFECEGLEGVECLKGSENRIADALSRIPEILDVHFEEGKVACGMLKKLQEEDGNFARRKFQLYKGVWCFRQRIFVPKCLRERVFLSFHGNGIHFGIGRTLDLIKKSFYFPGMDSYVEKNIGRCNFCRCAKNTPGSKIPPVSREPAKYPFQSISIDYAGPLPRTKFGNKYFLVVVDQFSRYVKIFPTAEANSVQTVKCLKTVFAEEGTAEVVMSDNGSHFTSSFVEGFLENNGVRHVYSPPYHPASNGLAERCVRTVKTLMKAALLEKGSSWDSELNKFQLRYNAAVHPSTGESPFEVARGRSANLGPDWLEVRNMRQKVVDWEKVEKISERRKRTQNEYAGGVVKKELEVGQKCYRWCAVEKEWRECVVVRRIGKWIYETSEGIVHRNHLQERN